MLERARLKLAGNPFSSQIELVQCDLEDDPALPTRYFNAVVSTYGVLSFMNDPLSAFRKLYTVMRPGAIGLLMSHSRSTALSSKLNVDFATPGELLELAESGIVRWEPDMPTLRTYTSDELTELALAADLEVDRFFGITSLVMPGREDVSFQENGKSAISRALENCDFFKTALDLELRASEEPGWAERGVNLMIKVRRPSE
jgi:SAM-dependent methyltransferase